MANYDTHGYYKCLGLNIKHANKYTITDIKNAFKKSLQNHPDKSDSNDNLFDGDILKKARDCLCDSNIKSIYDIGEYENYEKFLELIKNPKLYEIINMINSNMISNVYTKYQLLDHLETKNYTEMYNKLSQALKQKDETFLENVCIVLLKIPETRYVILPYILATIIKIVLQKIKKIGYISICVYGIYKILF